MFPMLVLMLGTLSWPVQATKVAEAPALEYRLRLFHTHTSERIDIVYRRGDVYFPDAINRLDEFLRDHRTGGVHQFDALLFDLLYDLTASVSHAGIEIDIIC